MSKKTQKQYIWLDQVVSIVDGLVTFENGTTLQYEPTLVTELVTNEPSTLSDLENKLIAIIFRETAKTIPNELFYMPEGKELTAEMVKVSQKAINLCMTLHLQARAVRGLYDAFVQSYMDRTKRIITNLSSSFFDVKDRAEAKIYGKEFADQATLQDYTRILLPS